MATGTPMTTARQREIIEQSIGLIARRGIQELTIRNLAKEIGISDAAIYRHFASKQEILLAVVDVLEQETIGGLETRIVAGPETAVTSARETLAANFRALFTRLSSAPELSAVIFADEVFLNDEQLATRVRVLMDRMLAAIEHLFARAMEANEVRRDIPPATLATMLVGTVRLIVRRWHLEHYRFNLESEGTDAVDAFLELVEPAA